jgi:hypothetical protein
VAGGIRSEREFMDALRALKARSGLSYRDIARRMSRMTPQHAVAKSTLASLFAQNALPRRPGQLTALVDVLAGELNEPAEVTSRYLEAWSRLMAARSSVPAGRTASVSSQRQPEPARAPTTVAVATPPPDRPPGGYRAPLYRQASYWEPRYQPAAPAESPAEFRSRLASALLKWLVGLSAVSYLFWVFLPPNVVPFWLVWIMFCWPVLLFGPVFLVRGRQPRQSSVPEPPALPAEYLRAEYRDRVAPASQGPTSPWPR